MTLRLLIAHNRYSQPSGEDTAFDAEVALLRERGHSVQTYEEDSRRIRQLAGVPISGTGIWSRSARLRMLQIIDETRPDLAHFHNIHPLLTPAVYYACAERGVPVVQTLHNYRLVCPAATLFRKGEVCEICIGRDVAWPSVLYTCYRGSRIQSAGVSAMLAYHNWRGTWATRVGGYIAMTEFARRKFVQGGLPDEKLFVKPNFVVPDPGPKDLPGEYALFVGRLSPEKGVRTILEAWQLMGISIPLRVVGGGPLLGEVQAASARSANVVAHGAQPRSVVLQLMRGARCLVFASHWYEGCPLVIAEAFACGLPVLAADIGSAAEMVKDGETGLLFAPGDPQHLAERTQWLWEHPQSGKDMGRAARLEYERRYTPGHNYRVLLDIYEKVLAAAP